MIMRNNNEQRLRHDADCFATPRRDAAIDATLIRYFRH